MKKTYTYTEPKSERKKARITPSNPPMASDTPDFTSHTADNTTQDTPEYTSTWGVFWRMAVLSIPISLCLLLGIFIVVQNTIIIHFPKTKAVYTTLGMMDTPPVARPNVAIIPRITKIVTPAHGKTTSTIYGVVYNATNRTHFYDANLEFVFLDKAGFRIKGIDKTLSTHMPPQTHTSFKLHFESIPKNTHTITINR